MMNVEQILHLEDRVRDLSYDLDGALAEIEELKDTIFDLTVLLAKHAAKEQHDPLFEECPKPIIIGTEIGIKYDKMT